MAGVGGSTIKYKGKYQTLFISTVLHFSGLWHLENKEFLDPITIDPSA